mgnify:FL=1
MPRTSVCGFLSTPRINFLSFENSHILNTKDTISVTVVAQTLEEADVYAIALFVANKKGRENLMKRNKNIQALAVTRDLKSKMYNNFGGLIHGA